MNDSGFNLSTPLRRIVGRAVGPLLAFAIGLSALLPCLLSTVALGGESLPVDRSALVLYKSLPYNQSWDDLETVEIEVVAVRPEDVDRGQQFASFLSEIAAEAKLKDADSPAIRARVRTVGAIRIDGYLDSRPHIIFLLSSEEPPNAKFLHDLSDLAARSSILLATDQETLLEHTAALGFLLSSSQRPEIVIDLERARRQGARFHAGFVRLARSREDGP